MACWLGSVGKARRKVVRAGKGSSVTSMKPRPRRPVSCLARRSASTSSSVIQWRSVSLSAISRLPCVATVARRHAT